MRQRQSIFSSASQQRNESLAQQPGLIYGTVVGTTGLFTAPGAAPAPAQNPVCNYQGLTIVPARSGAGAYTLTLTGPNGLAMPLPTTEYKYSFGVIGGAASTNVNWSVASNVVTVGTNVTATPTDENFWFQIEPITG